MTDLESMAAALEASGQYRVLRRLAPRTVFNEPDSDLHVGIALDCETTGLDPKTDEIIELAMQPFTFSSDGRIFEVREPYCRLRQPSRPIPAEITSITGIDDAAVSGQTIDLKEVADFIEPAVLIIAHHAAFDRPFAELLCKAFEGKRWACSMNEIDWRSEGIESNKLAWILSEMGLFYDRHRATADVQAMIEMLGWTLPRSGVPALAKVLEAARRPTFRVWALDSPFDKKDILKERRYRWSPGEAGWTKSWYIDIGSEEQLEAELAFLQTTIYGPRGNAPRVDQYSAFDRFSEGMTPP